MTTPKPTQEEVDEALLAVDDLSDGLKHDWRKFTHRLAAALHAERAAREKVEKESGQENAKIRREFSELLTQQSNRAEAAESKLADAVTRMEAAERCSGQWMKDRDLAIKQRDRAEGQLWAIGHKSPLFIHDGDHCPSEKLLSQALLAHDAIGEQHAKIVAAYSKAESALAQATERIATVEKERDEAVKHRAAAYQAADNWEKLAKETCADVEKIVESRTSSLREALGRARGAIQDGEFSVMNVLDFADGAIDDAILSEDGLDGKAGEAVGHMILVCRERLADVLASLPAAIVSKDTEEGEGA